MRDSTVVPVQRLMALRQYPGFAAADLNELAVLAENVVEQRFPAGAVITRAGRVPAIQLVLDGRIASGDASWGALELVGAIEAMAGRPVSTPIIAAEETRTLQLAAADLADILEDNIGLLSIVRRNVARQLLAVRRHLTGRAQLAIAGRPLGLVDRLLALRHQLPFANGRIQALAALAETAREVEWSASTAIARAGDATDVAYVIVEGAVRVRDRILGPGDAVGLLESLAEVPHVESADTLVPTRALQISASALFDLVEDHTDLGLAIIASLARELAEQGPLPQPDDGLN